MERSGNFRDISKVDIPFIVKNLRLSTIFVPKDKVKQVILWLKEYKVSNIKVLANNQQISDSPDTFVDKYKEERLTKEKAHQEEKEYLKKHLIRKELF